MTKEEKLKLIEQFDNLSSEFDYTLNLNKDIILFRPSVNNPWSVIEHIVHCADFDIANFHRYRWAIVSPGTTVLSFNANWVSVLNYQDSDLLSAINTIKAVRHFMAFHLRQIADLDWTKYNYSFGGDKIFYLEEALQHFINHVGFHKELIDRNIKLYAGRE